MDMRKINWQFIMLILFAQVSFSQWEKVIMSSGSVDYQSMCEKGDAIYAGGSNGVSISNDGGINWTTVKNGLNSSWIYAIGIKDNILFAGAIDNGIYISNNNGNSWIVSNVGITDKNISAIVVNGSNVFIGTCFKGIFLSIDNGQNWVPKNNGISNLNINAFTTYDKILYAGTNGGVFVSKDDGENWQLNKNGLLSLGINCISVFDSNVIVGTDKGVYRSIYGTSKWEAIGNGLPDAWINAVSANRDIIIACTSIGGDAKGIYYSVNNGINWESAGLGLYSTDILNFLYIYKNIIYAGVTNKGLWKRKLTELRIVKNSINKISNEISINRIQIKLSELIFSVNLKYSRTITINIYDLFGRQYNLIYKKKIGSGNHLIKNKISLSKGSYLLIINDDNKKLITKTIYCY
jgi:photosystem II stability/assembly factor-like uncharacterized protein